MSDQTTLFADGMQDAAVTHGVVRITLAQSGPDGKPLPAGKLIMPLVQLPAFANGLVGLLRQVESKMKEAQAAAGAPAAPAPAPSITAGGDIPLSGAFRFGG
jgi:hypothetical protein